MGTRLTTRLAAGIAVAGLAIGGLSACGGSEESTGGGNAAASPEGVDDGTELTMWTRAPLERQAKTLVEAYNASHENQVQLEIIPNDDMEGKVGGAASNEELPDLLAGDVVRLPYWVDNGLLTDITDRLSGLSFADDISQGHVDAGTDSEGAQHAVPFVIDISVVAWNKELYREAGLDPEQGPTNLAEFQQQAEAVQALNKPGVSGTFFGGNCGGCGVFTLFPHVWASGDEVLNDDGTESLLDSDSAQAVYDMWASLEQAGALGAGSKEETGATWTGPFSEGKVGVQYYPNTAVYAAAEAGVDVGVGAIPGVDGGQSTFLGGDAMGISKDSEHVDQAWNFLSWMLSDETQLEVVAQAGDVPTRTSLLENQYAAENPLALTMNQIVADGRTPVAPYFAEAFNASGSPWVQLLRNAVFEQSDTVAEDNEAITEILQQ
jgi:multiple sugar transport system substrate-binding protein